ncbi:MAG TPA: energy-coupling factor ABC transporter substrate-binding protein [Methanothermococcus okinawensis]|uniref:Cobalt transport protein CbiN n=1 Tax=Methanothermococcus okinawensis TaxID=155863 RepID=A0A832ZIL0_9EURY|nr:energy-coupling factor ABC transporter substrate-binding protein [Methanococcaceae archaeon]HIP84925.1 energy-coupling factor ABC transporter substrate-binding protein [Methanothermococcus okinawensis]HIP91172.1 energy-coupling factor ABC transporter substrate-binding protein [Methanothermococcus okinawensis]
METKHILMILGVIILIIIPLLIYAGKGEEEGYFGGADGEAEEAIIEMNPNYEPWFSPVWEPPSGEIESFLFALQAAIGAIIIGYFIGYNKARIELKSQS